MTTITTTLPGIRTSPTLRVDLTRALGPQGAFGVGFLHTFPKDDFAADSQAREWLAALRPRNWRTWATPKPLTDSYEAFTSYLALRAAGVETIQVSASCYSIFNRGRREMEITKGEFVDDCLSLAKRAKAEGMLFQYDIMNEGNLGGPAWDAYWVAGAQAVRSVIPDAVLIGPSHVNTLGIDFGAFLDLAQAGGVYPDVIAYHEFRGPGRIEWETARIRAHAEERGFPQRPVIVSEFWPTEMDTDLPVSPACQIAYFAAAQRAGVQMNYAVNNCSNTTFDHLLSYRHEHGKTTFYRNGLWWVHKAFVEMAGTACLTNSSDKGLVDGLASRDVDAGTVTVLIGSPYRATPGEFNLVVSGFDAAPYVVHGGRVTVTIRRLTNIVGRENAGFDIPSQMSLPVVDGDVTVPLALDRHQACLVTVGDTMRLPETLISGQVYDIRAMHSGQSFNVRGSSRLAGYGVEQFPYMNGPSQHWRAECDDDGLWSFTAKHSEFLLTAVPHGGTDDDQVVQRPADGSPAQRWVISACEHGAYRLTSALPGGLVLGVECGYQAHGSALVLEQPTTALSQRFQILPISPNPTP